VYLQARSPILPPGISNTSCIFLADTEIPLYQAYPIGTIRDSSDRVTCISHRENMATAIAFVDQIFAVGLRDGTISLCHNTTCEYPRSMDHREPSRVFQFRTVAKHLASSGRKTVKLRDTVTGHQLLHIDTKSQCLAMAFD
jgi:WD40 repeat protein